jgi:hypothetical protein
VPATRLSDGLGLSLAHRLGLPCHYAPIAALTPLTCDEALLPATMEERHAGRQRVVAAGAVAGRGGAPCAPRPPAAFCSRIAATASCQAVLDVSHVCVRSLEQGAARQSGRVRVAFSDQPGRRVARPPAVGRSACCDRRAGPGSARSAGRGT